MLVSSVPTVPPDKLFSQLSPDSQRATAAKLVCAEEGADTEDIVRPPGDVCRPAQHHTNSTTPLSASPRDGRGLGKEGVDSPPLVAMLLRHLLLPQHTETPPHLPPDSMAGLFLPLFSSISAAEWE